jgi:hypothetical protein
LAQFFLQINIGKLLQKNGYNQLPDEKTRVYWLLDEKLQENIVI